MKLTSVTIIPANGPKNTVYPLMNVKNPCALAKISHGTNPHPPISAQMICPLRMLTYRGNKTVMSLAAERELAEMLQPRVASINAKEAKKAAARLSHLLMRVSGSQRTSP